MVLPTDNVGRLGTETSRSGSREAGDLVLRLAQKRASGGERLASDPAWYRRRGMVRVRLCGIVAALAGLTVSGCGGSGEAPLTLPPGGRGAVVGTVRGEPRTFNHLLAIENESVLLSRLTQASLVRINRATDEVEPWLAEAWVSADDGRTHTLALRTGATFSDGEPFTSADVVFTFEAVYDDAVGSPLADSLRFDGLPIDVEAPDESTVVVRFPVPYSPGVRVLDSLPILPKHLLGPALRAGTLRAAWDVTTAPTELAGLGAFALESYVPGQRLVFGRNTRYWRHDARGVQLPYLDRITLEIVSDQNTEMLRLEAGEVDLISGSVRAEDLGGLERAERDGKVQLHDLGVVLNADSLFFNLRPEAMADDPRRSWLQHRDWRLAVSHAVDRVSFANTVYLGLAQPIYGPITPGNGTWFTPDLPTFEYDPQRADALLTGLGLVDRDGDGVREDANGSPVRFALLTQQGNSSRERAAQVLQADLGELGIRVDLVPTEFGSLIDRLIAMDFDAAYFGALASDTDPAGNLDFWLSSGAAHFWNPNQATPATDWEARVDHLTGEQLRVADMDRRLELFDEIQTTVAENQPLLYFAAPRVLVATSIRMANVEPSVTRPHVLWNADMLAVTAPE